MVRGFGDMMPRADLCTSYDARRIFSRAGTRARFYARTRSVDYSGGMIWKSGQDRICLLREAIVVNRIEYCQ